MRDPVMALSTWRCQDGVTKLANKLRRGQTLSKLAFKMTEIVAGRPPTPLQDASAVAVPAMAQPRLLPCSSPCSLTDLAAIIDSVADALISVDEDGRIVLFNAAASRMLACPTQQALGESISKFIPEGLRQAHQAHMHSFGQRPENRLAAAHAREVLALRADGQPIQVEVAVSSAQLMDNGATHTLSTAMLRDLTLRKALQSDLHRVSHRYRTVVDQSPDAIWLEEAGRLQLANAACAALLGAPSVEDLIGLKVSVFLPDWSPPELAPSDSQPGGPDLGVRRFETRLRRLDGRWSEVELSVAAVPDHGGEATQGVMRDITQRKRDQLMLQTTQASLLEAQRIARLGYYSLDLVHMRWRVSPTLQLLLGQVPKSQSPKSQAAFAETGAAGLDEAASSDPDHSVLLDFEAGLALVHAEDRDALRQFFLHDMRKAHARLDREYRIVRQDNRRERWVHGRGRVHLDAWGRATHLFGTLQDITERKRSELALDRSRQQLRRLSSSLTQAREAERRHVARELHDELGQRLSALKLDIATLLDQPGVRETKACDKVRPLLAEVDGALAAVRRIAADLRPPMLDDLGLTAALEWLSNDWTQRTGLQITLRLQALDELLTESAATTVYRIVQEALTNISRHARASKVQVGLQRRAGELLVWVEDDGVGLSPGDTDKRNSNGLAGIRERAHILGGAARIINGSEGGCRLEARLPLDRVDTRPGGLFS